MNVLKGNYLKYICLIAILLTQYYKAEAISCIQCGENEEKCSEDIKEKPKECPDDSTKPFTKCFTQIDSSGNIARGCITEETAKTCTDINKCIITENEKNNQLICKKCEGSDANCSQTDMTSNELGYNQICAEDLKKCLVKIESKLVVRGCASDSDIAVCSDINTCKICDTVNCNTGIFPTKRINCYQCSGSSCIDVVGSSVVSKPCLNYEENDECYTMANNEADMVRGCKSDTKENQCSDSNAEGCASCSTDKCNNLKYKYDQSLKCHQCSSEDASGDCAKEQTSQVFNNCINQILYNETEYCYTQIDGAKIKRGCLHDNNEVTLDNCKDGDSATDTCNKCNTSNGCNNKAVTIDFTCIVCRSDMDENCWNKADSLKGQKCRTSDNSAKEGCFHGIWNGVAIRGCMVDAAIQNQEICKDVKNHQCNACNEKDCNINKSSGTKKMGVEFGVLLMALVTFWNLK